MRTGILLTALGLLGVVSPANGAIALSPESTWSEIRSTPDVIVEAPMISFGADFISVTDVCVAGDKLRAVTTGGIPAEVPAGAAPLTYNIGVDRVVGGGEHSFQRRLFTKHFEVPQCG